MSEDTLMRRHKGLAVYFFKHYYAPRWGTIRAVLPSYVDLDDILQCCYIGLWEAIKTYNFDKGGFTSWVFINIKSQVFRLCSVKETKTLATAFSELDIMDSDGALDSFVNTVIDESIMDNVDVLTNESFKDDLLKYVSSLPNQRFRQVCLDRIDGCTYGEIACNNGITKQRVQQIWKVFTQGARSHLREMGWDSCMVS